ncbi:hypothetical protein StrepF001_44460 [Streptomyces sp. F001]|uniref:hypothetical protein n=1 Tax=Streptomyces sp. F001 TaxID=1510026 RepID=UPI00101E3A19|nr:hypothetical protein [Streptomyces sp. F001]RZB13386.1 hypothetical protein StrepF001_44460 [Streptomyces sp. F001]
MTGKQANDREKELKADLRRLAGLYRAHVADRVTERGLGRAIKVSPTTVGNWLAGKVVPQQVDKLVELVAFLAAKVADAGADVPPADRRLLDPYFAGR